MTTFHKRLVMGGVVTLFPTLSLHALAATNVSVDGSVASNVSFSDNICLSSDNEKYGYIAGLTPSASISASGRRTSFNANGSINLNSLTNSVLKSKGCNSDFNRRSQYNPQFTGNFNTATSDRVLKLQATARVRNTEVGNLYGNSLDEFDRFGSSNTLYRFRVSPSVGRRFGSATANASYALDEVINSNELAVDNRRHSVNSTIRFGGSSRFTPSITGRYTLVEYSENINGVERDDTELSSVRLGLGYRVSNTLSVNGSIGEEWNSFESNSPLNQDDNAWNFSVKWTPSPRTSLVVGMGDRFFGKTPTVNFSHQRKRSQFGLSYRRELRFRSDVDVDNLFDFFEDIDNFANPSILTSTPIVDERFALGWVYTAQNSVIRLSGDYSEQTNTDDNIKSEFKDVYLTYSPRSVSRINFSTAVGWREDDPRGQFLTSSAGLEDAESSESWYFNIHGTRSFSNKLSLSVSYRFSRRESNSTTDGYEENRITLTLGFHL